MERAASATSPNAVGGLEIHTLGAFQIAVSGAPLELGTRKAWALEGANGALLEGLKLTSRRQGTTPAVTP